MTFGHCTHAWDNQGPSTGCFLSHVAVYHVHFSLKTSKGFVYISGYKTGVQQDSSQVVE